MFCRQAKAVTVVLLAYLGIGSAVFSIKNKRNIGVSFQEEKKEGKYTYLGIEGGLLWKKINYSFFIGKLKNPAGDATVAGLVAVHICCTQACP